jgi:hypothetical protein
VSKRRGPVDGREILSRYSQAGSSPSGALRHLPPLGGVSLSYIKLTRRRASVAFLVKVGSIVERKQQVFGGEQ